MSTDRFAGRRAGASTERWALVACAVQALNTTIHHIRGAVLFDTPGRYASVLVILGLLALPVAARSISVRTTGKTQATAWWAFWVTSLLGFVIAFGVVEGLITHVVIPIAQQGYPSEPFDLLFQATGILHIVPAGVTALLLARLLSSHRSAANEARA